MHVDVTRFLFGIGFRDCFGLHADITRESIHKHKFEHAGIVRLWCSDRPLVCWSWSNGAAQNSGKAGVQGICGPGGRSRDNFMLLASVRCHLSGGAVFATFLYALLWDRKLPCNAVYMFLSACVSVGDHGPPLEDAPGAKT